MNIFIVNMILKTIGKKVKIDEKRLRRNIEYEISIKSSQF
jgi:hypothetical protein